MPANERSQPWILYDSQLPVSLETFGILIPLRDSRATKTFEALQNDPDVGGIVRQQHVKRVDERLSKKDLLRAHTAAYVQRLYSDQLEDAITTTYELVDAHGRYHRYDPTRAVRPLSDLFQRILLKAAAPCSARGWP